MSPAATLAGRLRARVAGGTLPGGVLGGDVAAGQDIRDLLGMRSLAARWVVFAYTAACVVLAVTGSSGLRTVWPMPFIVVLCAAGAWILVAADGDPLPWPMTAVVASVGAVASASASAILPVPLDHVGQSWVLGMSTALLTFLCVRGRTVAAWAGMIAMIAVWVVWAAVTGQGAGHGLAMTYINLAPLLMATFFALTIRPMGNSVFVLRARSTEQVAEAAASAAVLKARDAELDELDVLARPLLERIATGVPLSDHERRECALLEARIRDARRAPGLRDAAVVDAARAARTRGATVVLLDDGGTAAADPDAGARLAREVAERLDAAGPGTVTVRVLPPGRRSLASILIEPEDGPVQRVDYGHDGRPRPAAD